MKNTKTVVAAAAATAGKRRIYTNSRHTDKGGLDS